MLQNVFQSVLQNSLIVFNPKYAILEKTKQPDKILIKERENNSYLIKIIGYCEKIIKIEYFNLGNDIYQS